MTRFTRSAGVITMLAAASITLAGCATSSPGGDASGSADPGACSITSIGYSPNTLQTEFYQNFGNALRKAAEAQGITVTDDDPQQDPARQVSGIENLLNAGVQAIAVRAQDANSLSSVVTLAEDQNVPLISLFGDFPGATAVVGPDDTELGGAIGQKAAESLLELKPDKDSYNVVILNNDSLGAAIIERRTSMEDAFKKLVPNFEVVGNVEALTEEEGNNALNTILQQTQDIDVVLSTNDSSSLGAVSALQAAGFKPGENVVVAISGSTQRDLQSIIDGLTPGGPYGDYDVWADATLNAMLKSACGEELDPSDLALPLSIVDQSNAQELYDELYKK